MIETRGEHRSVESNPASFLPNENLERGDVTVANKTFGLIDILWREVVKQICRAVSPAQGDQARDLLALKGASETLEALLRRTCEISGRQELLYGDDFETEAPQFDGAHLHIAKIGGW